MSGRNAWSAMTTGSRGGWPRARIVAATGAVAAAVVTLALAAAAGRGGWPLLGVTYLALTALALFAPAAVTFQVLLGQLVLVAALAGGGGAVRLLLLAPALGGIVVTAELLALAARLDTPVSNEPRRALPEAGRAAGIAAGVFAAVALLAALPPPSGVLAVVLAAGALAWGATLLTGGRGTHRAGSDP